ncbi:MAG: prenyltransferase/squalene oxidase repeat-containing protein [Planctomycetota bacterium]
MRRITDHRFEEGDFAEALRGVVRGAPWWMLSLLAHGAALAVLWSIPIHPGQKEPATAIQASLPPELKPPERIQPEPPQPEVPPEAIEERAIEDPDDHEVPADPTDSETFDTAHDDGVVDAALTGPFLGSSIGLGNNAGGGPGGTGGPRKVRIRSDVGLTKIAVDWGLEWLAEHQDVEEDGRWDCDSFMKHDPPGDRCDGAGAALHDVGVTGLALLAFLGANYTDRGSPKENPFARHVRRGLRFLIHSQDEDGVFGSRASHSFMYSHAIATLAMCEAYWMTRNPRYRKPGQEGLNFLAMARNPYLAWRYEPRGGDNDTSVTGWCVMALKSGKFAGLEVDPAAYVGARLWIDKMTDPSFGQVGYNFAGGASARPEGRADRFPPEKTQSMTAVGILTRIFLGEDPRRSDMIRKGADLCVQTLPAWSPDDGSIDMYYWYYGTLALFQVGGAPWRKWNAAMKDAIVRHQHADGTGARQGSWDPLGAWGDEGGRVYATATMVMCLEVYYRYDRVFGTR